MLRLVEVRVPVRRTIGSIMTSSWRNDVVPLLDAPDQHVFATVLPVLNVVRSLQENLALNWESRFSQSERMIFSMASEVFLLWTDILSGERCFLRVNGLYVPTHWIMIISTIVLCQIVACQRKKLHPASWIFKISPQNQYHCVYHLIAIKQDTFHLTSTYIFFN